MSPTMTIISNRIQQCLGHIVRVPVRRLHLCVGLVRIYAERNIARQRPRRCRPDKDISVLLRLFDAPKFEHSYPHCWRCDTPLIYYARESWYIRETAVRDDLMRNNDTVNWIPESIGKGRFGNWLENM